MTATNAKLVRAELNKSRGPGLRGEERANSNTCRILSDAIRDTGDERLADLWNDVAEFLDVWAEHRRAFRSFASDTLTYASDRRAFVALDYATEGHSGASGCFLVEKATGYVWSIRGYGKKNRIVSLSLRMFVLEYRSALARAATRAAQ